MQLRTFLRQLYPIYLGLALFFVATTLVKVFFPEVPFLTTLSLRYERTIATWYETTFLPSSLSLFLLLLKRGYILNSRCFYN